MSKTIAAECKRIDVFLLKERGYLRGSRSGSLHWEIGGVDHSIAISTTLIEEQTLNLHYVVTRYNGEKKTITYIVPLLRSNCYFGGERWWFECPIYNEGKYCGRRVAKLYKVSDYFACRHCSNITYASRNENRRHKFYGIGSMWDIEDKIATLESRKYRRYYNGKPTRKYRQILRLMNRLGTIDLDFLV